jgi:hypothetical protein
MIIKKIFEGLCDEGVHNDFVKFSRGEFKNRYLIEGKKQAKNWTIKTGPEFANFFVKKGMKQLSEKIKVKGIISTTLNLTEEIKFEISKISQFQGVKKYIIDCEVEPLEILDLMRKHPKVFFALSFNFGSLNIKIKAKPAKSGKSSGKNKEGPKVDFCTIKTDDKNLLEELFWDIGLDWKLISVNHTLIIDGIVCPKDMASMKPAEVREASKRKGKVIRKINVDGSEKTSEKEFTA